MKPVVWARQARPRVNRTRNTATTFELLDIIMAPLQSPTSTATRDLYKGLRFSVRLLPWLEPRRFGDLPQPAGLEGDLQDLQNGDGEGVLDRLGEEGADGNGPRFAGPVGAQGVEGRGRLLVANLDARHVERGGEEEIHEGGVEELAVVVVDELFVEGV